MWQRGTPGAWIGSRNGTRREGRARCGIILALGLMAAGCSGRRGRDRAVICAAARPCADRRGRLGPVGYPGPHVRLLRLLGPQRRLRQRRPCGSAAGRLRQPASRQRRCGSAAGEQHRCGSAAAAAVRPPCRPRGPTSTAPASKYAKAPRRWPFPAVGSDPSALALRYQVTIGRTARECLVRGDALTIRIGVEGRIILGPAGGPGQLEVPIRYAVVQEGTEPKTITTKLQRVPVVIPPGQGNLAFTHVEEDLTVPLPPGAELDAYVIYVGFDPEAPTPAEKKRRNRRRNRNRSDRRERRCLDSSGPDPTPTSRGSRR